MKKALYWLLKIVLIVMFVSVAWPMIREAKIRDGANQLFHQASKIFISPCARPIGYAFGTIDGRFNLTQDQAIQAVERAEGVWETPTGQNLFVYDPKADLKINFIFDERQRQTLEAKKLEEKLDAVTSLQSGLSKQYDTFSEQYKKKSAEYDKGVTEYRDRVDKYAKDVEYWNDQGGAPEAEYDRLQKEKRDLEKAARDLENLRKNVNDLAKQMNAIAGKDKNLVENYNQQLSTYKQKYGESKAFDQGLYTGQEINIYQFSDTADLALVLAHELGHALGLDHVENPRSIMYYLMGEQNAENPTLTDEDKAALTEVCGKK